MEVFRPQNVPESRLRQQPRRVMRVLHVGDGHRGIGDAVVNNGVYRHCHRVLREHLKSHRMEVLVESYSSVEVEMPKFTPMREPTWSTRNACSCWANPSLALLNVYCLQDIYTLKVSSKLISSTYRFYTCMCRDWTQQKSCITYLQMAKH